MSVRTVPRNVIFVLTDDQGYADLGCTGNPWVRTPCIDALARESVRCADFHAQPLCTPTRGALMTGRRPLRNGAWATCWGRSILRRDERTLAECFRAGGFRTGMFGKWHLGDNYPYRPFDRGFETVVAHKGGGVGQTPDFWGNNYFDDTYFHNGRPEPHRGYCTDVWFDEAIAFIERNRNERFFAYLATNAPHCPWLVPDRYRRLYEGHPDIPHPAFYGMITNIDENVGRLRARLSQLGLERDTLLIFMTDNGSSGGCELDDKGFLTRGYNAGMRGRKGSYYDGGHRVPFFLHWPAGGIDGTRPEITEMALDIDVLPTLLDLCAMERPDGPPLDGQSLAPLLRGEAASLPGDRVHFLQYRQDTRPPEPWDGAVLTRDWRLIRGAELYAIRDDPGQCRDVAARHAGVVARLRAAQEGWWAEVAPDLERHCPIVLGAPAENPTRLDSMDALGDVAWDQTFIVQALRSTGRWAIEIASPGRYRFSLRRWPAEFPLAIDARVSPEEAMTHIYAHLRTKVPPGRIQAVGARLRLFGEDQTATIRPGDGEAVFERDVSRTGDTELEAWFIEADGTERGAYYVYVEKRDLPLESSP